MSREAVKYKITLEREDGEPLNDNCNKVGISFRSDQYGTAEYMDGLHTVLRAIEQHELIKKVDKEIEEEVKRRLGERL